LFPELRALILRKCRPEGQVRVRTMLEKEHFGALERLVGQKLLDVAKGVAKDRAVSEKWVGLAARLNKRTREQTRAVLHRLMRTNAFTASFETCIPLLDTLIESWNIDLETFGVEIVVNRGISPDGLKRFEFVEREPDRPATLESGLEEFLRDKSMSGLKGRHPLSMYYYRELQNLRDPVHFRD
jgi:hypothetical protein